MADLATKNIDLLLTINGSPYEEGKTNTRFELAQRRAAEVNAPVIYLNQVGGQDDLVFDGGSFVVDADGTLIERSPMFMENLTFWDFDSAAEHQAKAEIVPELDPDEEVYTACVLGLKDYMAKNHFTGVTLGLSGGMRLRTGSRHGGRRMRRRERLGHLHALPCTPPTVPKTTPPIWPPTLAPITRSSPLSHCSTPTNSNLTLMASPPRTCRPASAV